MLSELSLRRLNSSVGGLGCAGGHQQPGFDQVHVGIITGLGEGGAVRRNGDIITVQEVGERWRLRTRNNAGSGQETASSGVSPQ